jgi:excisionase family DNA binding protein
MTEYLTVTELAEYVRRSPGAIRNLVLRRAIPFRKPAGRLLFVKEEIDQWITGSAGISIAQISGGTSKEGHGHAPGRALPPDSKATRRPNAKAKG